MPSSRAARCQALTAGRGSGAGAVSIRNCSSAATIAAASLGEAPEETSSIRGLGGLRLPLLALTSAHSIRPAPSNLPPVPEVPVIDSDAVFAAVSPALAVERTREAFARHHAGEWVMPAKTYVQAQDGDFRAMPARGGGLAILKWVTSFPGNPARELPVVTGALLVSSEETGELLAVVDCAAVTALRTGAAAAVSAAALARDDARSVGIVGCGVNGGWAARALAAIGYGPGVCHDVRPEVAAALAEELGWRTGELADALAQDVVVTVTPGSAPVVRAGDLRPGVHIAALGADSHAKQELERDALLGCRLFCDEWRQASKGGELSGAAEAGDLSDGDVTELGAVLTGAAAGRATPEEITLFDSTGLAIQDLGMAHAVLERWRTGAIDAPTVRL